MGEHRDLFWLLSVELSEWTVWSELLIYGGSKLITSKKLIYKWIAKRNYWWSESSITRCLQMRC